MHSHAVSFQKFNRYKKLVAELALRQGQWDSGAEDTFFFNVILLYNVYAYPTLII